MLLKREVLEAIKRGEITLQFRRWSRPTVKPGGTLKVSGRTLPLAVEDTDKKVLARLGDCAG